MAIIISLQDFQGGAMHYNTYSILLSVHSWVRWFVLVFLILTLVKSTYAIYRKSRFTSIDNWLRHSTATAAHIQILVGVILYAHSPIIKYYWNNHDQAKDFELHFFGMIHATLMTVSIVVITIGSAMAKRKQTDHEKFRTMILYFLIGIIIILVAIPWPFSPLANRPYIR